MAEQLLKQFVGAVNGNNPDQANDLLTQLNVSIQKCTTQIQSPFNIFKCDSWPLLTHVVLRSKLLNLVPYTPGSNLHLRTANEGSC